MRNNSKFMRLTKFSGELNAHDQCIGGTGMHPRDTKIGMQERHGYEKTDATRKYFFLYNYIISSETNR